MRRSPRQRGQRRRLASSGLQGSPNGEGGGRSVRHGRRRDKRGRTAGPGAADGGVHGVIEVMAVCKREREENVLSFSPRSAFSTFLSAQSTKLAFFAAAKVGIMASPPIYSGLHCGGSARKLLQPMAHGPWKRRHSRPKCSWGGRASFHMHTLRHSTPAECIPRGRSPLLRDRPFFRPTTKEETTSVQGRHHLAEPSYTLIGTCVRKRPLRQAL